MIKSLKKDVYKRQLVESIKKNSGRNNTGRITSRHRGGGAKKIYRIIDFKRNKIGVVGTVAHIEYDPNRTANIALIQYEEMCIRDSYSSSCIYSKR